MSGDITLGDLLQPDMSPYEELSAAYAKLARAEEACQEAERTLCRLGPDAAAYRQGVQRAMADWRRANLALFDAQCRLIFGEETWAAICAAGDKAVPG